MSFSDTRYVQKTRKAHRCSWCNEVIILGQGAWYHAGVSDGDFYHGHFHPECENAMKSVTSKEWDKMDYTYEPGEFKRGTKEYKSDK